MSSEIGQGPLPSQVQLTKINEGDNACLISPYVGTTLTLKFGGKSFTISRPTVFAAQLLDANTTHIKVMKRGSRLVSLGNFDYISKTCISQSCNVNEDDFELIEL